jgi:hypothetical protein
MDSSNDIPCNDISRLSILHNLNNYDNICSFLTNTNFNKKDIIDNMPIILDTLYYTNNNNNANNNDNTFYLVDCIINNFCLNKTDILSNDILQKIFQNNDVQMFIHLYEKMDLSLKDLLNNNVNLITYIYNDINYANYLINNFEIDECHLFVKMLHELFNISCINKNWEMVKFYFKEIEKTNKCVLELLFNNILNNEDIETLEFIETFYSLNKDIFENIYYLFCNLKNKNKNKTVKYLNDKLNYDKLIYPNDMDCIICLSDQADIFMKCCGQSIHYRCYKTWKNKSTSSAKLCCHCKHPTNDSDYDFDKLLKQIKKSNNTYTICIL